MPEEPGTNIIVYPEAKVSQCSYPCYVTVTDEWQFPCPVTNARNGRTIFKVGTCLGRYEEAEDVTERVNTTIHNDLLPHADKSEIEGDREGKIRELLTRQDWSHLTENEREDLLKIITKHNEAFILEKGELGKIQGPPVHINLANPSPVRGPNYRYPEKAKAIIADLVKDM